MSWWQHIPEHIDPTVLSVGSFSVSWYGVAFLCGAVVSLFALWRRLCQQSVPVLSLDDFLDFSLLLSVGAVVGARLGYVLMYNAEFFFAHPVSIVSPFDSETGAWIGVAGMSAHGGILGIFVAVAFFAWRHKKPLLVLLDNIALSLPIAIFFGRIGNFLAGELFGRVTTLPWGMIFPRAGDILLRHPSQLYEASGEGILLWCILRMLAGRVRRLGQLFVWALGLYGGIRFFLEYFRMPDPQIGFIFGVFTLGQILSIVLMILSVALLMWMKRKESGILSCTE